MLLKSILTKLFLLVNIFEAFKIRSMNDPSEEIFDQIQNDRKHISRNIRYLKKFKDLKAKNHELQKVSTILNGVYPFCILYWHETTEHHF